MALDTFTPPVEPSVTSSKSVKAKVLTADFSDGYTVRAVDGLNSISVTMSLRWQILSIDDADTIEAFLEDHEGAEAFYYTIPREDSPRKFTCEEWTRSYDNPLNETLTATFKEVFDLV